MRDKDTGPAGSSEIRFMPLPENMEGVQSMAVLIVVPVPNIPSAM